MALTTHRLVLQPGETSPRSVAPPHPWYKHPGVYVQRDRDTLRFYRVTPTLVVEPVVDEDAATRLVLSTATDAEQVAHDAVAERVAKLTAQRVGPEVGQLPEGSREAETYKTALSLLAARGLDWQVKSEIIRRQDAAPKLVSVPVIPEDVRKVLDILRTDLPGGDGLAEIVERSFPTTLTPEIPEWQAVVRADKGYVLHVATTSYALVQHTEALAMCDFAAAEGTVEYRDAYASTRAYRAHKGGEIRTVEGETIGLRFEVPGASRSWVRAGGFLSTSHDGSSAIRATACMTVAGVTIFHRVTDSWKHTRKVAEKLTFGRQAMAFLARSLDALVRDADAARGVGDAEAAEIVLRTVAPDCYAEPNPNMTPTDQASWRKVRDDKREKALDRLHKYVAGIDARTYAAKPGDADYLGGLRYVVAAPYALSNRVGDSSLVFGGGRDRMTNALVALARHAGIEGAGLVPDAVVEGGAS